MEIRDILSLMQAVSDHGLSEFQLDDGNVKLSFKKEETAGNVCYAGGMPANMVVGQAGAVAAGVNFGGNVAGQMPAAGAYPVGNVAGTLTAENVMTAPLVGTFYSAPSPEAETFVKVGDTVKKGQVLGIIEAMKLMNEIESDYDGVVEAILVKNEDVVEYGQPLFRIR